MKKQLTGVTAGGYVHPEKQGEPEISHINNTLDVTRNSLSEQADIVISSEVGELVARIAGAVWVHNLYTTGTEILTIHTPEGRKVETQLKPSDVTDLICSFLYQAAQTAYQDKWKLTLSADLALWLDQDGQLSDYGIAKWGLFVSHLAGFIDYAGYGDAKH